jgi:single-stranded-DNA-specific exonuclease
VLGPAAAKLAEQYHKPVLLLADGPDGRSTGSARSVPGFDIAAALRTEACQVLLERHGGHSAAAGVTLATACIPDLARALDTVWEQTWGSIELVVPALTLDAEIPLARLTRETARQLGQLSPFGQANEEPLLLVRHAPVRTRRLFGRDPDRQHLKLVVGAPGSPDVEVVVWGGGDRFAEAANATVVDLAVRLGLKAWNGTLQLDVVAEDFRLVSA